MKLRVIDRLISAVVGILLLVMSVIVLTEMVFSNRLLTTLGSWAEAKSASHLLVLIGAALIMILAGVLSIQLAVRRTKRKGFVMQTTDLGELSISIRAIDNLVQKCVAKHEELHVTSTTLDNTRDGLVISMRINLASGVNIPLAVTALQKQIKQYVTACTGVDVHEVRVQVDTTAAKGNPSVYAVSELLENPEPLPREEENIPAEEIEPAAEEAVEKEEKCLHQRLFGEEEQPAIVPVPPEMEIAAEEIVEEAAEEIELADEAVFEEEAAEVAEEEIAFEEVAEEQESEETADVVEAEQEEETPVLDASAELETLAGLNDEALDAEMVEAEAVEAEEYVENEYVVDEESVAELEALDGAEDAEAIETTEEDEAVPAPAEEETTEAE